MSRPRCGNCDYDLTGSESNRCPECGKLFIEAGVIMGRRRRRYMWILFATAIALAALFLAGTFLRVARRAVEAEQRARAAAAVAERRAQIAAERDAAFQRQMLDSALHATSRPIPAD